MSWWDLPNGDLIGDEGADAVQNTLRELARKPAPEDLLRTLGLLLQAHGTACVSNPPARIAEITAVGKPGPWHVAAPFSAGELDGPTGELLVRIAALYADRWNRKPTVSEILSTFAFVLGFQPEKYLEMEPGGTVSEIRIG